MTTGASAEQAVRERALLSQASRLAQVGALLLVGALAACSPSGTPGCPVGAGVMSFDVPSAAMAPTIGADSHVLVDTNYYDAHAVARGDIVVFKVPPTVAVVAPGIPDLIKRVIGLPGESISSSPDGTVEIDGSPLREPWLPAGTLLGSPIQPATIPARHYYVLGDNRTNSQDSRFWGPISHSLLIGRVETAAGKVCLP